MEGDIGALAELETIARYADTYGQDGDYTLSFADEVGQDNYSDIRVQTTDPEGEMVEFRVEAKLRDPSTPLSEKWLQNRINKAELQIRETSPTESGHVVLDVSKSTVGSLNQQEIERIVASRVRPDIHRAIEYLEVRYFENEVLKRTFIIRNPDGTVQPVVTEVISQQ